MFNCVSYITSIVPPTETEKLQFGIILGLDVANFIFFGPWNCPLSAPRGKEQLRCIWPCRWRKLTRWSFCCSTRPTRISRRNKAIDLCPWSKAATRSPGISLEKAWAIDAVPTKRVPPVKHPGIYIYVIIVLLYIIYVYVYCMYIYIYSLHKSQLL